MKKLLFALLRPFPATLMPESYAWVAGDEPRRPAPEEGRMAAWAPSPTSPASASATGATSTP
ncbi:MAG: hypothetical protein KGK34_01290 [Chloroflexota bacterium]|nr:hypothetical protein [Chloroflexota bacterium]